ncbi:uncharacterized protein LOC116765549 [Danaus plexippus]|uniref:uncharacterized protein LOC116765549 n=1 Tax=Danaus plexippus TaxID=13037 RepID=UPI000239CBE2|nr:uncharacterized protein LOC116765549 [Danaus plexippus]XP_061377795.1 uncharacterized protein LOC116765549 [Danaus plexippus]XP_061377796.1 uncharacterized protein LOC116765549 [Danaus plexippus]XP_061377797.1 uncharacterized protein LOC116765549 [Danaus plexippus]
MCDCAEQLEKERQAPSRSPPARRLAARPSRESSGWFWSWLWGWAGDGKNWFPILGGATLLALLAFLYKSMGKMKTLVRKTNSCSTIPVKKQPTKPEKFKPCKCED